MAVLPTYAVYNSGRISPAEFAAAKQALISRVTRLFQDAPIAYRRQNDGDYPDGHQLSPEVAPASHGIDAHIRSTAR